MRRRTIAAVSAACRAGKLVTETTQSPPDPDGATGGAMGGTLGGATAGGGGAPDRRGARAGSHAAARPASRSAHVDAILTRVSDRSTLDEISSGDTCLAHSPLGRD